MAKRGGYARDFKNRFGIYPPEKTSNPSRKRIWIQAVSVGELRAIEPLVKQLHTSGKYWIAVTTTTSTAYKILQSDFKELTDLRGYFPLDFLPCSRKAWDRIQPDIAILMESELWPEHMYQAHSRGKPLLLINARLSDRSFRRYQKLAPLAVFLKRYLTTVSASSAGDGDRFKRLGLDPKRLKIAGNLKLDKDVQPRLTDPEIQALKREMGFETDTKIILGSSTWPGEEAILCRIYKRLKAVDPKLGLLIVPRHAERKSELIEEFRASGLHHHFRSDSKQAPPGTEVYIADTTGELPVLTQIADVAFIGKSLPPHTEAQSMIEPAILGIPAFIGPGYSNFRAIVEGLLQADLLTEIADEAALERALQERLQSQESPEHFKQRAAAWHRSNQGALSQTIALIESHEPITRCPT